MKGFIITILVLAAIAAGGWFAYDKGYLDSVIGAKSNAERSGGAEVAPPTPKPEPADRKSTAATDPAPAATAPGPDAAEPKEKSELDKKVEAQVPMPEFFPLLKIVNNWENVPERAFPKVITVNVETAYELKVDGKVIGSSKAAPGHKAVPLAYRPGLVQVSNAPDGSTTAVVKVDDTDFKEQIQALYDSKVADAKKRVMAARKVAREMLARPQQAGDPDQLASGWHDSMDPRFKPVRDYLAAGKLESGILEEAKDWRWLGSENHGGSSYDVVLVNFEVDTIFGKFPESMKCLLRGGQVVKWIDADTGEERT